MRRKLYAIAASFGLAGALLTVGVAAAPNALAAGPGSIVCGGDTCIQTYSTNASYATIHVWANRTTFTGHFYIQVYIGNGLTEYEVSPTQTWPAGGQHWSVTMDCTTKWEYSATAYNTLQVPLGTANFWINSC